MRFEINNSDYEHPGSNRLKDELNHIYDLTGIQAELSPSGKRFLIWIDDLDDLIKIIKALNGTSLVIEFDPSYNKGIPNIIIYDGYLE